MADDTKAQPAVEEKQPASMPDAQTNPKASDEKPVGESVSEKSNEADELVLPADASERTKEQFEKLRTELRSTKEELGKYKTVQSETPLNPFRVKPTPSTQSIIESAYDPMTGEFDIKALKTLEDQTKRATEQAQQATFKLQEFEDQRKEEEAYQEFPTLKTDSELRRKVRALLTDSILNPNEYGGKELTPLAAAKLLTQPSKKAVDAAKDEGAKEALERLTPKEQAALEATGRSDRRNEVSDLEDLRWKTRAGNADERKAAIMERLKSIPWQ